MPQRHGRWALYAILLFLVVLAALWILLQFAAFGGRKQLKEQTGLLRDMHAELLKANVLLRQVGDGLDRISAARRPVDAPARDLSDRNAHIR